MSLRLHTCCLRWVRALYGDRSGVTAIEYGLIAGAIAVAIVAVVVVLGESIEGMFTTVSDSVNDAGSS